MTSACCAGPGLAAGSAGSAGLGLAAGSAGSTGLGLAAGSACSAGPGLAAGSVVHKCVYPSQDLMPPSKLNEAMGKDT